ILTWFHLASGLKVNFNKSKLFGIGTSQLELNSFATTIRCVPSHFPCTYLGLPIGANMARCAKWDPLIDRFHKRLSSWKARTLSFGGRLTLCKYVLGSLGVYYFSTFKAPKTIINKLEGIRTKLFWGGSSDTYKIPLIAWNKVISSPKQGGLDIGSLVVSNQALLAKCWWRFLIEDNALWCKIIRSIHGSQRGLHDASLIRSKSGPWYRIAKLKEDLLNDYGINLPLIFKKKIGNGESTRFGWIIGWECVIDDTKSFSVKGLRTHITNTTIALDQNYPRWNKLVPIKVNIASCRIAKGRLPTKINLDLRGIDLHSVRCPLCDDDLETEHHLFIHCRIAKQVWLDVLRWWNLPDANFSTITELFSLADHTHLTPNQRGCFNAVIHATLWFLWRARNELVFASKRPDKDLILNDIKHYSHTWISSRSKNCSLNWIEWFCNPCSSFLYINCGGKRLLVGDKVYERDMDPGGASYFSSTDDRWGFSNTGNFLDDGQNIDTYILTNTSGVQVNISELYMSARISALSLTYYGFCMLNGSYIVSLHFAEIIFTNDRTYRSLGRRVFDIYLQGMLVEKDFDISAQAGGVGKVVVKNYTVNVTTTLEIRLYWAGNGTLYIPHAGVYGPLISAISVNPSSTKDGNEKGVPVGTVAEIVVGALNGHTGTFTLRRLKTATNNFDDANKIGEGGFGCVYKGVLPDGTLIAVKQLSSKSRQGNREFLNELGMISALQHPNLVKLHGCCIEGNQLLLAYEYMENNSLARALFGPEEWQVELDWRTRYMICIGIAKGLAFLHEESRLKIVHRDIKASNILLDKNLNAKISDFGLAKLDEEDDTHINTRIAGTYGYMAPEYAMRGYLTDKADVYSYGIVLLEIVSGMANTVDRTKENHFILLDRAISLNQTNNLIDLADPKLGSEYDIQEMMVVINLALVCTSITSTDRPTMSSVVSMLEERIVPRAFVVGKSVSMTEIDREQTQEISIACSNLSRSSVDLYPDNLVSDCLQKRE
ncbi:probable leucine-rich repeat receptor-like serine/threonine-protein kinase, partial [Tanacetum coccineum]